MERTAIIYRTSETFGNRHICFDLDIAADILDLLGDKKLSKKLEYIFNRILEQKFIYYENYVQLGSDISEMRISPNGANSRIYCKEVTNENGEFFVITSKYLAKKKSMKIDKSIQDIINSIKKYDYVIVRDQE